MIDMVNVQFVTNSTGLVHIAGEYDDDYTTTAQCGAGCYKSSGYGWFVENPCPKCLALLRKEARWINVLLGDIDARAEATE